MKIRTIAYCPRRMLLALAASLPLALAIALQLVSPAFAAKPSASEAAAGGMLADEHPPLIAVYLSIKQPHGTFVLASSRKTGAGYRKRVLELAETRHLEIVLPVVSDILQEAMTAVRIAAHDSGGLRGIAAMQGAKTVLAGRLEKLGDKSWSVTWSISNSLGRRRWQIRTVSFDDAVAAGLTATARVMAGGLAVKPYPLPKALPKLSDDAELSRQREDPEHLPAEPPQ